MDDSQPESSFGRRSCWLGWGHAFGQQIIPNAELEQRWGLAAGWIEQRTGFTARRYAAPDQATSDLAIEAGQGALGNCGIASNKVGLLLLATSTPDHLLPGTAPLVAAKLGIAAPAMDLMGACTGFLYGLILADHYVRSSGQAVLLIGANVLSRRVDPADIGTAALFGDAAGAIVLAPACNADASQGIEGTTGKSAGEYWRELYIPAGGSRMPWQADLELNAGFMQMASGRTVFKLAAEAMIEACRTLMSQTGRSTADIDWMLAHQASQRIVGEVGNRLEIPVNKQAWCLGEYGNSSAATIPLALSLGREEGWIKPGQRVLLTAAGAGFCSAAAMLSV